MITIVIFLRRTALRWRDIQRVVRFYFLDSFLFFFPSSSIPRTLLLVRLEGIGDYLLFHNFIKEIKQSKRYHDYSITLCGSTAYKELAITYDGEFLSDYIWVDTRKFKQRIMYRWKILRHIRSKGYETIIYPTYSRDTVTGDFIMRISGANERIGCCGDYVHAKRWERKLFDRYYTSLINISERTVFEFYKNKEFTERLLSQKIQIHRPTLALQQPFNKGSRYAVICPGSLLKKKRWPLDRFIQSMDYLYDKHGVASILVGDKDDLPAPAHQRLLSERHYIQNSIGNLSLVKTAHLIQEAVLVLTNDTSVSHIGVMLDKPIVIISNGEHYGRFSEYPKEIHSLVYYAYPKEISSSHETFDNLVHRYEYGSRLDIEDISIDQVIKLIDQALLESKKSNHRLLSTISDGA